jgi:hypothetical protein
MPSVTQPKPKSKVSKINISACILLAAASGLIFPINLGMGGGWISPWAWIGALGLVAIWFWLSYRSVGRTAFKRMFAFILLCVISTMPLVVAINVSSTQSTAMKLQTTKNIAYFKTVLGRSYNYTELIVWENQHLNFTYANIARNDDPIKIYEYGKGRCQEFATLYAALCISQGYRCRIVDNILNDHVFNEVLQPNGTWIRVDASLGENDSRAVGYPMFFVKEKGWGAPILSLGFENSTIINVTSTFRNDGFDPLSPTVITILSVLFAFCIVAITKFLILTKQTDKRDTAKADNNKHVNVTEQKENDVLVIVS